MVKWKRGLQLKKFSLQNKSHYNSCPPLQQSDSSKLPMLDLLLFLALF